MSWTREEMAANLAKKSEHFYRESLAIIEEKLAKKLRCPNCQGCTIELRYGPANCATARKCWGGEINGYAVTVYLICTQCGNEPGQHAHFDEGMYFGVSSARAVEMLTQAFTF